MLQFLRPLALLLVCLGGSSALATRAPVKPAEGPPLPLPEPAAAEIAFPNWPAERPLPNSVRAWHYNPDLVLPLSEVGDAVDRPPLTLDLRRKLAAVVASRNHCLY
jgi:hypothetical protein